MNFQGKQFNWVQTPSAWNSMQIWRARRSAMADSAVSRTTAFSNSFTNAQINQASGMSTLAARAAMQRIRDKALAAQKAKLDLLT